ncbi:MAG: hypothetical protein EA425_17025 [Puniceicoccaceae bacterium]|nr:MAG: hypothetical protein EA425_17025 [Puniceicoccaceae bacterium]
MTDALPRRTVCFLHNALRFASWSLLLAPLWLAAQSAAPVEFGVESGFFEDPFDLVLVSPTPGATIVYSLDGSDPDAEGADRRIYTGPVRIERSTVVQARAEAPGLAVSEMRTRSYLFPALVATQSSNQADRSFPPVWSTRSEPPFHRNAVYGVHPAVVAANPSFVEDIQTLPALSVAIDPRDLFDRFEGIYANSNVRDWDKPVSVEWIETDGSLNFRTYCGIRILGDISRQPSGNVKHSFFIKFQSIYGTSRIDNTLFPDSPVPRINRIALRMVHGDSWLRNNNTRATLLRDQFANESFKDMGHIAASARPVNLFLNGVYWGLYLATERPTSSYYEEYTGIDGDEWDVIKGVIFDDHWHLPSDVTLGEGRNGRLQSGTIDSWNRMMALATSINGTASNAQLDAIAEYLDLDNFIDYMMMNMYAVNWDWPQKNWYAAAVPGPGDGPPQRKWIFVPWDTEYAFVFHFQFIHPHNFSGRFHKGPSLLWRPLWQNPEFALRFADRVQKHYFGDGALTAAASGARFQKLADSVDRAMVGESARWGYWSTSGTILTRENHWLTERNRLLQEYFPQRTGRSLQQFRDLGLFPSTSAPALTPAGGPAEPTLRPRLTAGQGAIFYTTDGSDPRLRGGAISPTAQLTPSGADLPPLGYGRITVKARTLHNGVWSPLQEATYATAAVTPHPVADSPFVFDYWPSEAPAGTYPEAMIFEQTSQSDPDLATPMDGYWTLPYNLESRSRINGLGPDGIAFINTANAQAWPDSGYLGSAIVALDTRGARDLHLQWTGGTVTPNNRTYGLRLQYRADPGDAFTDFTDSTGAPIQYLRHPEAGHRQSFGPIPLPSTLEERPYVELRWKYHHVSGGSGPRAQLSLGDIVITAEPPGAATALSFASQPPAVLQAGEPLPPVVVRAVDTRGLVDPTFNGPVTLSLDGTGSLTGTTTVSAAAGIAVFYDLGLDGAGAMTLLASAGGLTPAASDAFRLLRLTERVMPRFIQGEQDATNDNHDRIPFAFRLTIEGLEPNAVYRYGNRIVTPDDPPDQNGAGNGIYITGPDTAWIRNTNSPRFRDGDLGSRHWTFTTDAAGAYTGWFVTEPSGNQRFTPGNTVFARLLLNDGDGGEETAHILTTASPVTVLRFGSGPDEGSGFIGDANQPGRNFAVLHASVDGSSRPLAAVPIEITGSPTDARYATFYHQVVAATEGAWGAILPNDLTGGLRRIELRSSSTGDLLDVQTAPAGFAATILPAHGLAAVHLDGQTTPGDPVFLPTGSAAWAVAGNWSTAAIPNAPGAAARIGPALLGNRNVDLGAPITIGRLVVDNAGSPHRNRIREINTNRDLRFEGTDGPALLHIEGGGEGFVEFQVEGGVLLASDLQVRVDNPSGDPEFGALRMREAWHGPGGLVKQGPGVLSLTGGGKAFTGPLVIEEGVVRITESSAPAQTAGVRVDPGGQLRLVSTGGTMEDPRIYSFGGANLQLASLGRGGAVPAGEGEGILGALRLDPDANDTFARLDIPLEITGPAGLHVDGTRNRLILTGTITGLHPLVQTGGGTIVYTGQSPGYTQFFTVANGAAVVTGSLGSPILIEPNGRLEGSGSTGPLLGSGTVALDATTLTSPSVQGLNYAFRFTRTGDPDLASSTASGNAVLRLTGPTPFVSPLGADSRLEFFLDDPAPLTARIYRGGFLVAAHVDLAAQIADADVLVFVADPTGAVEHFGRHYRLYDGPVTLETAPATATFPEGPATGNLLQLRVGPQPTAFPAWQDIAFPDQTDPALIGPGADPARAGLTNLQRYGFGIGFDDNPAPRLPRMESTAEGMYFVFPYNPALADLAWIVEATDSLGSWTTVLFDSRSEVALPDAAGLLRIPLYDDPVPARRFLRVRLLLIDP